LGVVDTLRLRWQRKRFLARAVLRRRQLTPVQNRTPLIRSDDVLLFCTLRNERVRLPYFLSYYRELGVAHFLFVDNGSDDGSREYLAGQPDVSVWTTPHSYRHARYGMDWLTWLHRRYGHEHWCLTVDADEFFVYPYCETRPLKALTDWLDVSSVRSFSALLLDMYPKGDLQAQPYVEGDNPFDLAGWFDSGNYAINRNPLYGNLWIQGGPRARSFFADKPAGAPALNKIPLVKWHRRYAYVNSTHMLLPRGLNLVYDAWGGEKASGVLLHAKFIDTFEAKADEELKRRQHFANSAEYRAYRDTIRTRPDMWCRWSEKYVNWRQLEILGLMSKGNWA
jgi:Glycosyl transferase family 2